MPVGVCSLHVLIIHWAGFSNIDEATPGELRSIRCGEKYHRTKHFIDEATPGELR
jgi:hypothetical protein